MIISDTRLYALIFEGNLG